MLRSRVARLGKLCFSQGSKSIPELAACEIVSQRSLSTALFQPSAGRDKNSRKSTGGNLLYQPSLGFAIRGFSGDGVTADDDSATLKTYTEEAEFPDESVSSVAESAGNTRGSVDLVLHEKS